MDVFRRVFTPITRTRKLSGHEKRLCQTVPDQDPLSSSLYSSWFPDLLPSFFTGVFEVIVFVSRERSGHPGVLDLPW